MSGRNPEDGSQVGTSSSAVWRLAVGGRGLSLGRGGTLAVSRIVDQAVLGLSSLLLAWRLGVVGFIPISSLLIINSLCVVGSNLGLGTEILRRDVRTLSVDTFRMVRRINAGIALVALVTSLAFSSPIRIIVLGSGLIWVMSGEAYLRKSALLRLGHVRRAAIAEMSGSAALASAVILAALLVDSAALWIAIGLVAKHTVESLVNQGWQRVVSATGLRGWQPMLWLNSILNYAISNIDFVIVALLISSEAFSLYSLGYRVASALVAQVSYSINRVALVDFGDAYRSRTLTASYVSRRDQMGRLGVFAAVLTMSCAPFLYLLGSEWRSSVGVVLVLACAVPWRMCSGLGLNALVAADGARRAARCEGTRLAIAIPVLSIAAQFDLSVFTAVVVMVAIGTAASYDRLAVGIEGRWGYSWLQYGAPIGASVALAFAGALIQ